MSMEVAYIFFFLFDVYLGGERFRLLNEKLYLWAASEVVNQGANGAEQL